MINLKAAIVGFSLILFIAFLILQKLGKYKKKSEKRIQRNKRKKNRRKNNQLSVRKNLSNDISLVFLLQVAFQEHLLWKPRQQILLQ